MTKENILVVDDEESVRRLLQQFFICSGFVVTTARNGEEALAACRRQEFALALTDLRMPSIEGKTLLRRLKSLSPTTEVIMMTGFPTVEDAVQTLREGAYDFVLKPFNLVSLEKTVRHCLEKQQLTKDLTFERQLRQKFAELDRLKAEFLANLSHELRTPLSVIMGYAEMLLHETDIVTTNEAKLAAKKINENAYWLLALISDLLDLAALEEENLDLSLKAINLREFLTDLAPQIFFSRAQGKLLQGSIAVDPTLREIFTDPTRLRKILRHLCENAVKFTPSGEISLTARRTQDDEREWAEIAVTDTGIGIAPEQYAMIFEDFRQVDGSSTRRYGGLGIGLALCRKLVGLLGGKIEVDSQEGRGSTFRVFLPLDEVMA